MNINIMFKSFIFIIWGLGIGDWGLGPIPNPQSPIIFEMFIELKLFLLYEITLLLI